MTTIYHLCHWLSSGKPFVGRKNLCPPPPSPVAAVDLQPPHRIQLGPWQNYPPPLGVVSQSLSFDLHLTSIPMLKEFAGCSQLRATCTQNSHLEPVTMPASDVDLTLWVLQAFEANPRTIVSIYSGDF